MRRWLADIGAQRRERPLRAGPGWLRGQLPATESLGGSYAASRVGRSEHGDTSGDTWPLCVPTNREPREFWRDARRRDSEWMVSIIALASIYTVWSDGHRYKVGSSGWTIDEFVRLWI